MVRQAGWPCASDCPHPVLQRDNGIETRRLAVDALADVFTIDPNTLSQRFAIHAPELAADAGRRALHQAGVAGLGDGCGCGQHVHRLPVPLGFRAPSLGQGTGGPVTWCPQLGTAQQAFGGGSMWWVLGPMAFRHFRHKDVRCAWGSRSKVHDSTECSHGAVRPAKDLQGIQENCRVAQSGLQRLEAAYL